MGIRKIDRDAIVQLYFRAILLGKKAKLGDDAEDFASWLAVKWLEGKSLHQTLDQSLIDYKRYRYGSSRSKEGRARMAAIFVPYDERKIK